MSVEITGFGKIAAITGVSFRVDGITDTDSLRKTLELQFPLLKDTKYVLAVNKQMVTGNIPIAAGSVVALMPPFSGG